MLKSLPAGVTPEQFAIDANESDLAGMSAGEQAKSDAGRMDPELWSHFTADDDGKINTPENRDFIREYSKRIVSGADRNKFTTADGALSQDGEKRVRNAVFHAAYNDSEILARLSEDSDSNIKTILTAMLKAAPTLAVQRQQIAIGNLYDRDLSGDVAAAAKKLAALRDQKSNVKDYFAQLPLMDRDLTPIQLDILKLMHENARSGNRIGEILQMYAARVNTAGHPGQGSMFESGEPGTKAEILDAAIERVKELHKNDKKAKDNKEPDVHKQPAVQQNQSDEEPDRTGRDEAARAARETEPAAPAPRAEPDGSESAEESGTDPAGPRSDLERGPHGPILRQFYHDPAGAIKALLKAQTGDAIGALYNPHVGDVDIVFGEEGPSGFGLAHIIEGHQEQMPSLLEALPRVFESMTPAVQKKDAGNNIALENERYRAIVTTEWRGTKKVWLLSFFRAKPSRKMPPADGIGDVAGTHETERQTPPLGGDSSVTREPTEPQASDVAFPGEADEGYQQRIEDEEAKRAAQWNIGPGAAQPLGKKGKDDIEDSPLFGGDRQGSCWESARQCHYADTSVSDSGVLEPRVLEPSEISIFRRPDEASISIPAVR